ncbi:EAL domain-containing protein [Ideonella sp. DXS29W]|uniref:EAL domain-containing protein n=1 Tax=Ideonella lacteola TaxID=2984193 RepID=A0ABU9BU15_9BURK
MDVSSATGAWSALDGLLVALVASGFGMAGYLGLRLRQARRGSADVQAQIDELRKALHARERESRLGALMNRSQLEIALDDAVEQAKRDRDGFSVLYVDLDGFRSINDAFGHDHGDELLRAVARQLVSCVGPAACHIAGDEFALLVPGSIRVAHVMAQRVADVLSSSLTVGGQAVPLTCSIGIAHYPEHGSRPLLLSNATLAMRSIKLCGGGGQSEYHPDMGAGLRDQAELLQELRLAAERQQFKLMYQPKIDARSLQVTAAEALLRWHHPKRGMVPPSVFIPLAERHGLIGQIGQWVIEEACRQAQQWRTRGLRMRVAVNLSGYQLRQDDIVERIEGLLRQHRIPPERFTCEITESVAMEDTQVTRRAFERLRDAGVHVSIDDFGTGYSSLASLRRLPAAELKIDRAFVCDLEGSSDAQSIVQAIVQMAHTMGLRVVAEGVETPAQRDALVAMGCDELQGYLFAKPMSPQALELWATDDRPTEAPPFRASLFEETRPADVERGGDRPA